MRLINSGNFVPRSSVPLNQILPSDPTAMLLIHTCFTASSVGIGNRSDSPVWRYVANLRAMWNELAYQKLPSEPVVHA